MRRCHIPIKSTLMTLLTLVAVTVVTGCTTEPKTPQQQQSLTADAEKAVWMFQLTDPGLKALMKTTAGYAVFPNVTKGGVGIGGAYGKGVLYENGSMSGYCDLSQGSIGFQVGGQSYSELILFQTPQAVAKFKSNQFAFAAQASAVAATSGAAEDASYDHGVLVFTLTEGGLMYEASVGGQRFTFVPAALPAPAAMTPMSTTPVPAPAQQTTSRH